MCLLYMLYRNGNILSYIKYREMGIEKKIYRFRFIVLSRPPGDLPYEEYYRY